MSDKFNKKTDELIERYVYDVTRRLSEKQRKDIGDELRGLIEDMILEKMSDEGNTDFTGKTEEEITREVLMELGSPVKLARKYRGEEAHLIGGEYYDTYCLVLKTILIVTAFGYIVSGIVSIFVGVAVESGAQIVLEEDLFNFAELPSILLSLFGAITLLFAFLERTKVKIGGTAEWDISKLPVIPIKKAEIKRLDCVVSLVFDVLFASIFLFAPALLGAWIVEDGKAACIPIFNLAIWPSVLALFILNAIADIFKDTIKLIEGCYNKIVFISTMLANFVSIICVIVIFKGFRIWNPNFASQLELTVAGRELLNEGIAIHFGSGTIESLFMYIILFALLLDTIVTIVKTIQSKGVIKD